jgi:hypothetical protein
MAGDPKPTQLVLSVLNDPAIGTINFAFKKWRVEPHLYRSVSNLISQGDISVFHDQKFCDEKSVWGAYVPSADALFLREASISGLDYERLVKLGTIVHECTHAGFVAFKLTDMKNVQSEQAAWVAQYVFMLAKREKATLDIENWWIDRDKSTYDNVALRIARIIYKNTKSNKKYVIPWSLWALLEVRLREIPLYGDVADQMSNFGLKRSTLPPARFGDLPPDKR